MYGRGGGGAAACPGSRPPTRAQPKGSPQAGAARARAGRRHGGLVAGDGVKVAAHALEQSAEGHVHLRGARVRRDLRQHAQLRREVALARVALADTAPARAPRVRRARSRLERPRWGGVPEFHDDWSVGGGAEKVKGVLGGVRRRLDQRQTGSHGKVGRGVPGMRCVRACARRSRGGHCRGWHAHRGLAGSRRPTGTRAVLRMGRAAVR